MGEFSVDTIEWYHQLIINRLYHITLNNLYNFDTVWFIQRIWLMLVLCRRLFYLWNLNRLYINNVLSSNIINCKSSRSVCLMTLPQVPRQTICIPRRYPSLFASELCTYITKSHSTSRTPLLLCDTSPRGSVAAIKWWTGKGSIPLCIVRVVISSWWYVMTRDNVSSLADFLLPIYRAWSVMFVLVMRATAIKLVPAHVQTWVCLLWGSLNSRFLWHNALGR